jgi:hypothetical protein
MMMNKKWTLKEEWDFLPGNRNKSYVNSALDAMNNGLSIDDYWDVISEYVEENTRDKAICETLFNLYPSTKAQDLYKRYEHMSTQERNELMIS